MPTRYRRFARALVGLAVVGTAALAGRASQAPQQQPRPIFRSGIDLVMVNVVVRDKSGQVVRGLTRDDFVVTEDGRPQTISTFGFEELDVQPVDIVAPSIPTVLGSIGRAAAAPGAAEAVPASEFHGRRLIVLLFDLSSMQPEEVQRALDSARDYVTRRLTPADLMAVTSLATSLQVVQDFTADRDALIAAIDRLTGVEGMGFEETVDLTATSDAGFAADDTEFNVFNTDRRLEALKSLADAMAPIEQKKSVVYFSSGMNQTGLDNRVAIRTVIDRAVRANVSIYAADMRGLQAVAVGGEARQASTRGQSAFTGASTSSRFDQMAASQDALSSLAEDTGGRAFFDQNEFAGVFDRVVADTSAYYLLGFTSTNREKDGRFRRIRVQAKRPDLKLEYRAGYYAPRDFAHSGREDREQQLIEQQVSDLSVTDLPVYAASAYFRQNGNRYFVPVWLVVPGAAVPFASSGDKDRATLDILGVLRDEQQRPVGRFRDTINLSVAAKAGVRQKNVQYQTDFDLPPGSYRLKVVVRENQGGTMGTFETTINVPNLDRDPVKVSSVVLGTQFRAGARRSDRNPLVSNGQELLANIAHVVSPSQHLYFYYELYEPATTTAATGGPAPGTPRPAGQRVRVLSNVVFFHGRTRVYETPLVEVQGLTDASRKAAAFQLDVPATELKPGLYTCQVNLIDDIGGTFAFPRLALYVRR